VQYVGVDVRIILNLILKKYDWKACLPIRVFKVRNTSAVYSFTTLHTLHFFETPYAKFSCRSRWTFAKFRCLQIEHTAHSIYIIQKFPTILSVRNLL
jgi:hypothetical protein